MGQEPSQPLEELLSSSFLVTKKKKKRAQTQTERKRRKRRMASLESSRAEGVDRVKTPMRWFERDQRHCKDEAQELSEPNKTGGPSPDLRAREATRPRQAKTKRQAARATANRTRHGMRHTTAVC